MKIPAWKLGAFILAVLALLALALPSPRERARGALALGQLERARDAFMAQIREDPNDLEAWMGLAALYETQGDPERQIAALEIAARRVPSSLTPLEQLVAVYEWNKDIDGAMRTLERLTRRPRGETVGSLYRLLDFYAMTEQWAPASETLRRLIAHEPRQDDVLAEMTTVAQELNQLDDILRLAERYALERPTNVLVQRRLAELYDLTNDPRARAQWRVVAALAPNDPQARLALAEEPGEPGGSGTTSPTPPSEAERLEQLRRTNPRDETSRQALVAYYRSIGEIPKAEAVQRELLALRPDDPSRLVTLAELLVQEDRGKEAIPLYERALVLEPDRLPVLLALAQLYEWNDKPDKALAVLDGASALRPDDRALTERTLALAEGLGRTDRAVALLDRLAAQDPKDDKSLRKSIDLLVAANRNAEAISRLQRLVARNPQSTEDALRLAELYQWTGREPDAINVYETLDRAGRLPEAKLARLGELYRFQNRPGDFLPVAERLLARQPGDEALRLAAVDAASGLGRNAEALRLLRPLVDARPHDEALVLRYVTLAAQEGRLADTLAVHRRFLAGAARPSLAYRAQVARLMADLGHYKEAIQEYEAVLAATPVSDVDGRLRTRLALADLYEATGAGRRALDEWEAIAQARPRDVAAWRNLGRRAMGVSRNELALRAYQAILKELPDDPEALKRAGQLLAWGNDPRGARRALERFNRVKGGDFEVHHLLGDLYSAEGDAERARAEYERAMSLLPSRRAAR